MPSMVVIDREKVETLAADIERRINGTGLRYKQEKPQPDRYGEMPLQQEGYYDSYHGKPRAQRTTYRDREVWELEVDFGQPSRHEIDGWSPMEETIKLSLPDENAEAWRKPFVEFTRFRRPQGTISTGDRVAVSYYSGSPAEKDVERLLSTLAEQYPKSKIIAIGDRRHK